MSLKNGIFHRNRSNKSGHKVDLESASYRAFEADVTASSSREFRSVFRAARFLGLFPVSGLNSNERWAELVFRFDPATSVNRCWNKK